MKTPTWAYVVGIMMICFGGCSITSDIQSINSSKIIEMQQKMLGGFSNEIENIQLDGLKSEFSDINTAQGQQVFNSLFSNVKEMFSVSEFTKKWMVRFGYIGLLFSAFYVLGGIFLIAKRTFSIKLVYIALGLSICLSIIQSIVLSSDSSGGYISMFSGFSQMFGIMIDIILLVVVLVSDKVAYKVE